MLFFIVGWVFVLLFSGIFDQGAEAYLDPGTGSYIFQIMIAIGVGAMYAAKVYWAKITRFFKNLSAKKK
jgi:hypothetical protein